jgi:hypothetical protein
MKKRVAQLAAVVILFGCWAAKAAPTLALEPDGNVSGAPGQTVGWGFTITNDTGFFLLFDSSQFCEPGQDPQFTTCTQTLGTYTDYIASNGTLVAPHGSASQTFNPSTMTGIGAYTIDPSAPLFATDSGSIIATYMEYQGDPFNGGTQASGDIEISAPASVTVNTPEPVSLLLVAAGLLVLGVQTRRCRRDERIRA